MRAINVYFEDGDFERLRDMKGDDMSWREFILYLAGLVKDGE